MTEPTPGPWMAWLDEDTNKFSVYRDHGRGVGEWIAEVHGTKGCFQANARLIAAAPDLLDALERLVHMAECNTTPGPNTLAQARAAIKKATGQS